MTALVYVAGPLTTGVLSQEENARRAVFVGERVRAAGLIPFVPHALGRGWEVHGPPHDWEWWMSLCLDYVDRCDALIRIEGKSSGSDIEVARAEANGTPTFAIDLRISCYADTLATTKRLDNMCSAIAQAALLSSAEKKLTPAELAAVKRTVA